MLYLFFKKTKVCNPHEKVSAKMIKIKSLLLKGLMSDLEILLSKTHSPSDFLQQSLFEHVAICSDQGFWAARGGTYLR